MGEGHGMTSHMSDRRVLALVERARLGSTEGERLAARNALRSYVDIGDPEPVKRAEPPPPETIVVYRDRDPEITWRQPALKLGMFAAVACIAMSQGWGFFWTVAAALVCSGLWNPKA